MSNNIAKLPTQLIKKKERHKLPITSMILTTGLTDTKRTVKKNYE